MTKRQVFERLDWAQSSLEFAIKHASKALEQARASNLLEMDDADWIYYAIEHADDARHAILNRGLYPRLSKEVDYD